MAGWIDSGNAVQASAVALARELSDPIRLTALQLLAAEGPHAMVQLADAMGISPPRLGNHLARLRAAGLVEVEHTGRHAVYFDRSKTCDGKTDRIGLTCAVVRVE